MLCITEKLKDELIVDSLRRLKKEKRLSSYEDSFILKCIDTEINNFITSKHTMKSPDWVIDYICDNIVNVYGRRLEQS